MEYYSAIKAKDIWKIENKSAEPEKVILLYQTEKDKHGTHSLIGGC